MANDGTVKIGAELDSSGIKSGLKDIETDSSVIADAAKGIVGGITAAAGAAAATLLKMGSYAVQVGGDFSAGMSQVQAISGATGTDMEALSGKAQEMGATTKFSASEAASAMTYMAMAGWKTGDMLNGVEGIMNLAAASGSDLASTSDIVTDALTAFGLSASDSGHFADIMAAASSNANTNVSMMGETFKYVAPVAGALGYSAEDVAVAIGLMANAGIKSSQAGTSMRSWLTRMAKPTKESTKAMKALGISLTNTDGSMKSFSEITEELRNGFSGLTESEQASYAAMLGGQEAMSGILAIANASDADYFKLTGAIQGCDGAAQQMAGIMQDNLPGDITIAKSAMEGFGIAAFQHIEDPMRNAAQKAGESFGNLTKRMQSGDLASAASKIGSEIDTISGKFIDFAEDATAALINSAGWIVDHKLEIGTALAGIGVAFGLYKLAVDGATTAHTLLNAAASMNPLILAGAAIAGIGAAILIYDSQVNKFSEDYNQAIEKTDEIKTKVGEFNETLDEHKRSFEDSKTAIDNNAGAAEVLAGKLFDLADKSDKTAADQFRLKSMCEELNTLIPDMNIHYDEQTDSLSRTREEVNSLTEAYKRQAIESLYQEQMLTLAKDTAEAIKLEVEAQAAYDEAMEKGAEAYSRANQIFMEQKKEGVDTTTALTAAENSLTDAEWEQYDAINAAREAHKEAHGAVKTAEEAMATLEEEMNQVYEAYGLTTEAAGEAANAQERTAETAGQASEALADQEEKTRTLGDQLQDYAVKCGLSVDEVTELFNEMSEGYKKAYDSALDSIKGQIGLFDEFKVEQSLSAEDMLNNLQTQIDGMTTWSDNMQALAKAGIDDGLLHELQAAGPSSAALVQTIATEVLNGNDQFINELNDSYREKMRIAEGIAGGMAEAETGFLEYADRIGIDAENMEEYLTEIGASTGRSYNGSFAGALESTKGEVTAQTDSLEADTEAKKADYEKAGKDAASGYTDNMSGGIASSVVGVGLKVALISALYTLAAGVISGCGTSSGSGYITNMKTELDKQSGIQSSLDNIVGKVNALYTPLQSAGSYAGDGIINGLVGRLNSRYWEVYLAVEKINAKAREAMKINSPSKVMMETGAYAGEGLILGTVQSIDSGLPEIEQTVTELADKTGYTYNDRVEEMRYAMGDIGYRAAEGFARSATGSQGDAHGTGGEQAIDFHALAGAFAQAIQGMAVNIDGQPAGEILARYVNNSMGDLAIYEGRGVL